MNFSTETTLQHVAKMSFSWYDYILFSSMLLLSSVIGVYFGCFGTKQSTTNEYLMGDKRMKVFPITVSLVASHISGITLLALPADVYIYGIAYMACLFSLVVVTVLNNFVFLPIFFNLNITSTYEYLEKRFDTKNRKLASFIFAFGLFLYLPIVIYIPALAFSTATGINVHLITPIVCGVCIFYTTIGGLKAVVYTDTIQFTITLGALFTVFFLGVKAVGGFTKVFEIAGEGDRLNMFDFDPDLTKRDSFWSCFAGISFSWISSTCVNQSCVQKFMSLPTLKEARISTVFYNIGIAAMVSMSCFMGIIMYAKYATCDPFTTGGVQRSDELLPYFIMDVGSNVPGLPGVFIAGIFCAALATLSACLNCLSGTLFEDFISPRCKNISEKTASNILKLIVLITGIICTSMVFLIEKGGNLLPLNISLAGASCGPLLGIFCLGIFFHRATSKGSFYGTIAGLIVVFWIVGTTLYYKTQGYIKDSPKPTSVQGCAHNMTIILTNSTSRTLMHLEGEEEFVPSAIFRLSHYIFPIIGTLATIFFGWIISLLDKDTATADKDLLSPLVHWLLPKNKEFREYYTMEHAIKLMMNNDSKTNKEEHA